MTVIPLRGVVQHYPWGGKSFIPHLLNLGNEEGKPFAEYWLGAHDNAPSMILNGVDTPLNQYIERDPGVLGASAAQKFGRLPYLLKVLDVKDMLSIQVHPSRPSAAKGFALEESKGIARNAPDRNYKDANHKPELALALGEFYLLHGFRPAASLINVLNSVPELSPLANIFGEADYRSLYGHVMSLAPQEVNAQLDPLLKRITPLYDAGELDKSDPGFWAARAALTYAGEGIDRGIYSVYFFNLVRMSRGQAIFQDAGLPHAYLEGQNIEIMANSDNVLRGGLTNKYVDVPELMKHIHFVPTVPNLLDPVANAGTHQRIFKTTAADFELSEIELAPGELFTWKVSTVEIALVFSGSVAASEFTINAGEALMLPSGESTSLVANEHSIIYKATVPY